MIYAPIVIVTYNRFSHFVRCVESLRRCTGAENSELFVGIDYPLKEDHRKAHDEICDYCKTITGFKSVNIFVRETNYGLVKNEKDLVDRIEKLGYDRFISSEDDNEFAPNALEYLNQGLEKYKDNLKVKAICSMPHPDNCLALLKDYDKNCYCMHGYLSWGNGYWINRNDGYKEFPTAKEIVFSFRLSVRLMICKKFQTLHRLLFRYENAAGDLRMNAFCSLEDRYCIFPTIPKVRNWGFDGSGLNCAVINTYEKRVLDDNIHFSMDDIELKQNKQIKKMHDKYYGEKWIFGIVCVCEYFIFRLLGKRLKDFKITSVLMEKRAASMNI